ncbi:hypothetical protein AGMMS49938_12210 [Fibrobacterales bacterium]|nr:hypothetical protein AGMMS49938_12210 [Fibrobacterales bacterium]
MLIQFIEVPFLFFFFAIIVLAISNAFSAPTDFLDSLDIRILRVEFQYEEKDNSLTTGRGIFNSDTKNYKLDPQGKRASEAYWLSHIKFAEDYYKKASSGKIGIRAEVYPKSQNPKDTAYKLQKFMIDYNRTAKKKGEKAAEFDSAKAVDYVSFVRDVLTLAKEDTNAGSNPLAPLPENSRAKRIILIAHAGSSRLIDGGTLGTLGANTPGDFTDSYLDTTWGANFWRGFEVSAGDTLRSVMVSSETASQDGLNWGINGIITSQIGRELGLPFTYDIVKGYSRLGYFDGMDYAGYNAGSGFFPAMPSAFLRYYRGWETPTEIKPKINEKTEIELAVGKIIKIPINANEYLLLENRQRALNSNGKISVKISSDEIAGNNTTIEIPIDSLRSHFLDSATQKYNGIIESVDNYDAAIPASGIAVWHINDWFIREVIPYGAVNAWNGDTFRDHQFGIALVEADGILSMGKEFRSGTGEPAFDFGSGSDLLPHDSVFSINPAGYGNTASTFGGYSGIKITAKVPSDARIEKTINSFNGDSVVTYGAQKFSIVIEWIGKYAVPIEKDKWKGTEVIFETPQKSPPKIYADINNDGIDEEIFWTNNRLYALDTNKIPIKNFPVILSNGEPLNNSYSAPLAIDIDGDDSLEILIPADNGLILAVKGNGKLFKDEFPLAAGTFIYENTENTAIYRDSTHSKFPMYLSKYVLGDSTFLFAEHRGDTSAFYLPLAKEFLPKTPTEQIQKDEIYEFFIFPNPVRNGRATSRFVLGAPAEKADIDFFDITGFRAFGKQISAPNAGSNQIENLELSKLGSDIYSVRLSVKFLSGKKVEKWIRVGVIGR